MLALDNPLACLTQPYEMDASDVAIITAHEKALPCKHAASGKMSVLLLDSCACIAALMEGLAQGVILGKKCRWPVHRRRKPGCKNGNKL